MPYRIAGIDAHKKMLAVVVADVEVDGDYHFERQKVGTSPAELRRLADWLVEREVEEVVMESTAQYWRPVWEALERYWRSKRRMRTDARPLSGTLHLAQAQSNRGAGGRKRDFPDAGTFGEASGGAGAHLELCARRRTAALADRDAPQVPDHAQPRATPQPADLVVKHESHHHIDLILHDPSIVAADALFLYPRRLNTAQRLSSPSKTQLDRILEALRRGRADFGHLGN